MILVSSPFNRESQRQYGLEQSLDDDRKVALFEDEAGAFLLIFVNGSRQQRIALTREAGEAVFELIGTALSEGMPQGPEA